MRKWYGKSRASVIISAVPRIHRIVLLPFRMPLTRLIVLFVCRKLHLRVNHSSLAHSLADSLSFNSKMLYHFEVSDWRKTASIVARQNYNCERIPTASLTMTWHADGQCIVECGKKWRRMEKWNNNCDELEGWCSIYGQLVLTNATSRTKKRRSDYLLECHMHFSIENHICRFLFGLNVRRVMHSATEMRKRFVFWALTSTWMHCMPSTDMPSLTLTMRTTSTTRNLIIYFMQIVLDIQSSMDNIFRWVFFAALGVCVCSSLSVSRVSSGVAQHKCRCSTWLRLYFAPRKRLMRTTPHILTTAKGNGLQSVGVRCVSLYPDHLSPSLTYHHTYEKCTERAPELAHLEISIAWRQF